MLINPKRILVLGGTGFVGRHLVAQLSAHLHAITVPTRRLPARHLQMLPGVSLVQADVNDPRQLQHLVRGHDVVVNLVAILHGHAEAFEQIHAQLPAQLARACQQAGVSRIVHVSALGASPTGSSMYQRSKARGEAALHSAAQTHGLGVTILRPSVIFGKDDAFINLFARLQRFFPVMPLAGAATRFQPVWVGDVAQALVHAIETPTTAGQVFEACGSEVFTLRELVGIAGRWQGRARPVIPLPEWMGQLQALALEWAPGPTLMSRDNLASMRQDNVSGGRLPGLSALGIGTPTRIGQIFPPRD